jgi:hypothetical protein
MKTYCFECKHDCHCGRKCDHCSCYICNNIVIKTYEDYMGGNMIDKIKNVWQNKRSKYREIWKNHKVCTIIIAVLIVAYIIK